MKNIEKVPQINPEEEKIAEEVNYKAYPERKRVDKLRDTDNKYTDSVKDLAGKVNDLWDTLPKGEIEGFDKDKSINLFSKEALENIENEKEKFIDPLTELPNRRFFKKEIPKILSLEKRKNKNTSVIMLDIDNFKSTNDEYGHDAGDKVLKEIVSIAKDSIRDSDFVFRWGGEEFIFFLPDTDEAGAKMVAEKIRKNIEKTGIKITSQDILINKTVSLGYVNTAKLDEWSKDNIDTKKVN